MKAAFTNTIVSDLPGLLALVATAGMTAVVTYISYWWALHYGLISLNEHGKLTLKPKSLPPGSMGLPMIGQTFVWMKNKGKFYDSCWRRHGEIHKTHLFGEPTVVVATHEAAKVLLISNADSLKGHFPGKLSELVGSHTLIYKEGEMHTRLRKLFMKHLRPEALKSLLPAIEELALKHLSGWSNGSTITFLDEIEKYTFGVAILVGFGPLSTLSAAKLNQEHHELEKGYVVAPINKPGYQWYDSMQVSQHNVLDRANNNVNYSPDYGRVLSTQLPICGTKARNKFTKEVQDIINTRQTHENSERPKGILDSLADKENDLSQTVIHDNMILLLSASVHTAGTLISFTLKYLHDHPNVLQKVKDEQEKIRRRKAFNDPLSWEDLKDMPYTYQVLLESGRNCNPVAWQYRRVTKELQYKGYVIPKNWRVVSLQQQWHQNPELFPDPHKFDPSRFETPKPALAMFAVGTHFCAGYELA